MSAIYLISDILTLIDFMKIGESILPNRPLDKHFIATELQIDCSLDSKIYNFIVPNSDDFHDSILSGLRNINFNTLM